MKHQTNTVNPNTKEKKMTRYTSESFRTAALESAFAAFRAEGRDPYAEAWDWHADAGQWLPRPKHPRRGPARDAEVDAMARESFDSLTAARCACRGSWDSNDRAFRTVPAEAQSIQEHAARALELAERAIALSAERAVVCGCARNVKAEARAMLAGLAK